MTQHTRIPDPNTERHQVRGGGAEEQTFIETVMTGFIAGTIDSPILCRWPP